MVAAMPNMSVCRGGQVLPKPKGWDFAEAATIPETFFTVQQTLIDRAKPQEGDWVLVHGGSGGIGGQQPSNWPSWRAQK